MEKSRRDASIWHNSLFYEQKYWNKMLRLEIKIFLKAFDTIYFQ